MTVRSSKKSGKRGETEGSRTALLTEGVEKEGGKGGVAGEIRRVLL